MTLVKFHTDTDTSIGILLERDGDTVRILSADHTEHVIPVRHVEVQYSTDQ